MTNPVQAALRSDPSGYVNDLLTEAEETNGEAMYLENTGKEEIPDLVAVEVEIEEGE